MFRFRNLITAFIANLAEQHHQTGDTFLSVLVKLNDSFTVCWSKMMGVGNVIAPILPRSCSASVLTLTKLVHLAFSEKETSSSGRLECVLRGMASFPFDFICSVYMYANQIVNF